VDRTRSHKTTKALIENPRVGGSIPSPATMYSNEKAHFLKWAFSWVAPNPHVFAQAYRRRKTSAATGHLRQIRLSRTAPKTIPQKGLFLEKSKASKSPQL